MKKCSDAQKECEIPVAHELFPKEYDLVILGGGSAAFAAAIKATELGAEVAVCEEWVIGGTCLNRGCIPSKNLLKASELFYYSHHHPFQGIEIPEGKLDYARVIKQKDELVRELREEKAADLLLSRWLRSLPVLGQRSQSCRGVPELYQMRRMRYPGD